jgi:asparagine synthase (glutamine-hydrolysing)
MCGIAGVVNFEGASVDGAVVERMVNSLAHRGPDGRGLYCRDGVALGHLRLSILDPTPAGAQPMSRSGNVLVHNGEVYNYLELAAELRDLGCSIDTGTDTEVILAAYEVWGLDAVKRFNGMFAFALWDANRRRLVLARDRLGVKPLYIRRTGRSLAFASELPAFVAGRPIDDRDRWSPEPHLGAVHDFLARGKLDHSTATFLDGVTALRPGHVLVVEDAQERRFRFWGPPPLADDDRATVRGIDQKRDEALVEEFRETFDSSVRIRLRSDVPIGTCLSGGLDSSSIVVTVAKYVSGSSGHESGHEQVPRVGFHARFQDHGIDESEYAELVARQSGIRLVYRSPTASPLLAAVLPVLRAQGEPYGNASTNAQHAVMAAAHDEGLKVLLDGQGADELLGGYLHYGGLRTVGLLAGGHPMSALNEIRDQVRRGTLAARGTLAETIHHALPSLVLEGVREASRGRFGVRCTERLRREPRLAEMHSEPGTFLARYLWQATVADGLPALLRFEDRTSMAFGIEARVPFLDVRLVELAVRLPDRLRVNRGVTKAVLRRAMSGRLPDKVARRRDKLGFAAPQLAWLRDARPEVTALIQGGQVVQRGWVAASEADRVLAGGFAGGRQTDQLWRLFITEAWLRLLWPEGSPASGRSVWERGLAADASKP